MPVEMAQTVWLLLHRLTLATVHKAEYMVYSHDNESCIVQSKVEWEQ